MGMRWSTHEEKLGPQIHEAWGEKAVPNLTDLGITIAPAEVDLIKHLQPTAKQVFVDEATHRLIIETEDGEHHVYSEREIEELLEQERRNDEIERELQKSQQEYAQRVRARHGWEDQHHIPPWVV